MVSFKKILFPVDLSDASSKVVPCVQTMVIKFGSSLHLLHVNRTFEHFDGSYIPHPSLDELKKEMMSMATKQLEEFRRVHFSDLKKVSLEVTTGYCAEEIIRYVESNGIDLLIMGTHGRKGLDRMIFGSVARRVSQDSPVPVLLINPFRAR